MRNLDVKMFMYSPKKGKNKEKKKEEKEKEERKKGGQKERKKKRRNFQCILKYRIYNLCEGIVFFFFKFFCTVSLSPRIVFET